VWEGVTYYLTATAVDQTLACTRRNSGAGGELYFDCMIDAPDMAGRYGVQFRIPEGALEVVLAERGYATCDHLLADDLEKTYLTLAAGGLAGHGPACFGLVRAAPKR
jgi:O-methyltransferase involved in polyketide biosynthesis